MRTLRAAAVQLTGGDDPDRNVLTAERLVREAAARGAELVVLPEKWPLLEPGASHGPQPLDGAWLAAAAGWARELGIWLVAGSILEEGPDRRARNTCVVLDPSGAPVAVYRKIHLFDVEVGGRVYRESEHTEPGADVVGLSALGVDLGLAVCYDLRFPELFRELAGRGMDVLALPSAFTLATGRDHWEVLVRARAIENQCFVIGANQVGVHANGSASSGRSMIVDPWGTVLAQAPDEECAIVCDLDIDRLAGIRERLPALRHRRGDLFGRG